jgi:hypothetical protein
MSPRASSTSPGGVGVDHIAEVDFGGNLAAALRCLRVNDSMMIYATKRDDNEASVLSS